MTQEFKSIEEIKEEVRKECSWDRWDSDLCEETIHAYAQQYIDANKELVEMLERIVDAQFNPNKSLTSLNMAIADAKELIAKHTTNDKSKEVENG